ncbi:M20/M25/M40 family metallo-hydrolase [Candidatus Halobonum tyrrellensis]|uniref:Acetylornithine deacetylase/succinyldiaminopimelate desuccinylase-like deacylase n=1 Tax=Candidatus Halobonum tyrrellensis G22 TaxID=1324957 RepID=V4GVP9_9EURY|nr:M20/M25/M40 family metallo-hydrolase [Candidatus Halobonum tyrrellensis]ESP89236.1 acetylornithine deacetylase/succinyldiaminopimelate desuccinylase-like deacylase [Candidatus Halobonum tyrrellensis G22]
MPEFSEYDEELRTFVESLIEFDTTGGGELAAQEWLRERFEAFGFETYEWAADAEALAVHPEFPDDPAEIQVEDRPSVAGAVEFGDPDAGPTVVLNGHVDVVPADETLWETDPFDPVWGEEDGEETLTARGAADMKAGLSACVFAARLLMDAAEAGEASGLDGRVVVESVVGEEEGGVGAATAALDNPYPFDRDAALVAEPTGLTPVVATEGSVMKRLHVDGRSAHAARRWNGESVLPHFERIRRAFERLEAERAERVRHPLYERFDSPWPVNVGVVRAGSWPSSVPASLDADVRIGVAPGETLEEVEAEYDERLAEVVADSEWLSAHPPTFERTAIQFTPGETDPDAAVVGALREAMAAAGVEGEPVGETYGADSRHYIHAGIPTVLFGPGDIDEAHFPNESIAWPEVSTAGGVVADAARRLLS